MGERGTGPKSLVKRSNGCRELGRCPAMCLRFDARSFCVMGYDMPSAMPLSGTPSFPFYKTRESMGYNGRKKENQRQRKSFRVVGHFFSSAWAPLTR